MNEMTELRFAEDKVLRNKKKLHYKEQNIKCCLTCDNSMSASIEDPLECRKINPERKFRIG